MVFAIETYGKMFHWFTNTRTLDFILPVYWNIHTMESYGICFSLLFVSHYKIQSISFHVSAATSLIPNQSHLLFNVTFKCFQTILDSQIRSAYLVFWNPKHILKFIITRTGREVSNIPHYNNINNFINCNSKIVSCTVRPKTRYY